MSDKLNKQKDISNVEGKVVLRDEYGNRTLYNNAAEAMAATPGNYYIPMSSNREKNYQVQLPSIDVVGYKPDYKENDSQTPIDPVRDRIFQGYYNGRKFEPTSQNISHYLKLYENDKKVNEGYGWHQWGKLAAITAGGAAAAGALTVAAPILGSSLYSVATNPLTHKLAGEVAGGMALHTGTNELYKGITGSNQGYMADAADWIADKYDGSQLQDFLNKGGIYLPGDREDFKTVMEYSDPAAFTTKPITMGYNALAKGMQPVQKLYNTFKLGTQLNKATKTWDGTVGMEYFRAPDKWYRYAASPEIYGIREQGMNVTTRDLADMPNSANSLRELVINKGLVPGTGQNEGYWILPQRVRDAIRNKRIAEELGEKPRKLFNLDAEPGLLRKTGSAHGNRSQGAWQVPWNGSTATTEEFPKYLLEGNPLANLTIPVGKNRSFYVYSPIDEVPFGARIGFKTGEMPIDGLRAFRKLPNGRYQYEGLVLPDKRISRIGDLEIHPDGFYHQSSDISRTFNPDIEHNRWFSRGKLFYNKEDDVIQLLNPRKVKIQSNGEYQQISPILESEIKRFKLDPGYGYKIQNK